MAECEHPLIDHRGIKQVECPDPGCTTDPGSHHETLPCRWSWQYAHGRAYGGKSFPAVRCPECRHIRRGGMPTALTDTGK